jgi:hypothetical protein
MCSVEDNIDVSKFVSKQRCTCASLTWQRVGKPLPKLTGEVKMASRKLNLTIATNFGGGGQNHDKSEIQEKLKRLVKLLALDAAKQFTLEGVSA